MSLPEGFDGLPTAERQRIRLAARMMSEFASRRCGPILITGSSTAREGRTTNGSGFVLQLRDRFFVGTAWHVVKSWRTRTAEGERLLFQVGLADLPPVDRFLWKDEANDIAFLEIEASDVDRIGIEPCEPSGGWPPPRPVVDGGLLMAGYPGLLREQDTGGVVDFGSFVGNFRATTVDDYRLHCQFQREYWVSGENSQQPPVGCDLGGMSGGPVFLIQNLAYPLVGMISEHNSAFEIMRVQTFGHLPPDFDSGRAA